MLLNIEEEEQRDQQAVTIALRHYNKGIKQLFGKYSNTAGARQKRELFDEKTSDVITFPEVWKMCREHDLDGLVTREEVSALVRLVAQRFQNSQ